MRRTFAILLLAVLVTSCALGERQTADPAPEESSAIDGVDDLQDGDAPDGTNDDPSEDAGDEPDGQAVDSSDGPVDYEVCDLIDPTEVLLAASDALAGPSVDADDLVLRPTVFPGVQTSPSCEANLRSLDGSVTWGIRDPEVVDVPDPDELGDHLVASLAEAEDDLGPVEEEIDLDGVPARLITSQERRNPDDEDHQYYVWLRFSHGGVQVQVDGRDFVDSPEGRDAATTAEVARETTLDIARLLVAAIDDAGDARPARVALDATCPSDEEALAELLDGEVVLARSYERRFLIVCFYATETTFARLASERSEAGELSDDPTTSPFDGENRELDGRTMVVAPTGGGAQAEVEDDTCRLRASYEPVGLWDTETRFPSDLEADLGDVDAVDEFLDAFVENRVQRVIGLMELLYDQAWDARSCPS